MRNYLFAAAAAAATVMVAAPAAAQYYPQPYQQPYAQPYQQPYNAYGNQYGNQYGYAQPYGNANGYGQPVVTGNAARWAQQLGQVQQEMRQVAQSGRLSNREINRLQYDFNVVDRAVRKYNYGGVTQREAYDMDRRIQNLRIAISRAANNGQSQYNQRRYYNGY